MSHFNNLTDLSWGNIPGGVTNRDVHNEHGFTMTFCVKKLRNNGVESVEWFCSNLS